MRVCVGLIMEFVGGVMFAWWCHCACVTYEHVSSVYKTAEQQVNIKYKPYTSKVEILGPAFCTILKVYPLILTFFEATKKLIRNMMYAY